MGKDSSCSRLYLRILGRNIKKYRPQAMRKFINFFGGSVLSASVALAAAQAADMPLKAKAPLPTPVMSWTGWYAGLNAGGIWPNSDGVTHSATAGFCDPGFAGCLAVPTYSSTLATGSTFNAGFGNRANFLGGGQFGYDWQLNANGVAGFETDIAWTNQSRSVTFASITPNVNFPGFPENYAATITSRLNYIGTVRGRLGFLATPSFLLYGTGGLAYGGTHSVTAEEANLVGTANTVQGFGGGNFGQVRAGWTVGAGGEWMFAPNWSAKLEYLYYDLGSVNYATTLSQVCSSAGCGVVGGVFASTTGTTSLHYSGSIARVGINWHFNNPLLAKY
jgi:outer membrane immunogenic protein